MKINILSLIFFVSSSLWAQTSQEVDVKLKIQTKDSELIKQSLLFQASLNSVEQLAPEFQVNYLEFLRSWVSVACMSLNSSASSFTELPPGVLNSNEWA